MKTIFISALFTATLFAQPQGGQVRIVTEDIVGEGTPGAQIETRKFFFSNGQGIDLISGINVGPTVTKAPYAAEAVTEFIQTLYDGNRIVQRSSTKQYRDSAGRERREEGTPLDVVFITDPVAKLSLTLHPDNKTAEKFPNEFRGQIGVESLHIAKAAVEARTVKTGPPEKAVFNFAVGSKLIDTAAGNDKEEDLGTRMIEGVEAKGTRTTNTIAAGAIGNDRSIDIVDERWYSPGLQLTVLTRHIDPRSGENTYKLVNIQRIEQVRSLFEIPSGYTVHEAGRLGKVLKEEE